MQELLIVNPARRPSKRRKSSKPASPAQKRARAAFAAASRARAGKPRKSAKRRAASKPSTALTIMSNPRKRRRSVAKVASRRRRRRNPIAVKGLMKKPMAMLTPALIGALGATAVNTILARLPVPAAAMTGKMRYVTQAAAAIGLSIVADKMGMKGSTAMQMAEGSLTVTLHQAIADLAGSAGVNLSGMGYYLPGRGAGRAIPSRSANTAPMAMNGMRGMGQYVTGPGAPMAMAGMGRQTRKKSGFNF